MRKIIFILLIFFGISACKKGDSNNQQSKNLPDKIILNQPEVLGTTSVRLTWSRLNADNFDEYDVQRELDSGFNSSQQTLARISNKEQTLYVDNEVPYKPNVRYFIIGKFKISGQNPVTSNTVSYSRPTANLLFFTPFDVLFNKGNSLLYLIENNGNITIYDVSKNQVTKAISTGAAIGYIDTATYKGKKELYVPRNDGWVFVYDAITLDKIAQLNTGINGASVISRKNLLFVSSYNNGTLEPLKVISRSTGLKVSESSNADIKRLKYIPGSDTDLLGIGSPAYQNVYRFTDDGKFKEISYPPSSNFDFFPDLKLVEFFPDGSKYIASSKGDILNKDMSSNAKLAAGDLTFSTFAFSNDQSSIYAGTTNKTIESYSTVGYNHLKSYTASGIPIKIFDLGTQLLSISTAATNTPGVSGTAIEKLNK